MIMTISRKKIGGWLCTELRWIIDESIDWVVSAAILHRTTFHTFTGVVHKQRNHFDIAPPPPCLCNSVIIWPHPLCNTVIIWPYPRHIPNFYIVEVMECGKLNLKYTDLLSAVQCFWPLFPISWAHISFKNFWPFSSLFSTFFQKWKLNLISVIWWVLRTKCQSNTTGRP